MSFSSFLYSYLYCNYRKNCRQWRESSLFSKSYEKEEDPRDPSAVEQQTDPRIVSLSLSAKSYAEFAAGDGDKDVGGLIQGAGAGTMVKVLGQTLKSMWKAIVTIIFIIAVAKVMGYSGMTSSIATLLAALTGSFFPALAPLVGILGTFVTGSTTSSGILFAGMQVEVAQKIRADALQLVAANMAGGAIGKLISPQSIAVAIAAIGLAGADGKIMSQTVKYCVLFGVIVGIFSYVSAVLL